MKPHEIDIARITEECGWNNRRYMTPEDYDIWIARMIRFEEAVTAQLRAEVELCKQTEDVLFATIADEALRSAAFEQAIEEARKLPDHWRREASRGFVNKTTIGVINLCAAELEQALAAHPAALQRSEED